jgi:hypothetical protein
MFFDQESKQAIINEKIALLRDFCILGYNATRQEESVRIILGNCASELQMEQKLHDVLVGKETLKAFIKRYGAVVR